MTVLVADRVLDASCNDIKNNVTEIYVCSGDPATRAAAITNALATRTGLDATAFTGPVDGDVSGRKVAKDAEADITIDATGVAATVVLCSGTELIVKTDVTTPQSITSGGTVSTSAFDFEAEDAVAA